MGLEIFESGCWGFGKLAKSLEKSFVVVLAHEIPELIVRIFAIDLGKHYFADL